MRGTGVALVTPFTNKLEIDFEALAKLIDHCILGGVEYLVALGTTGESVTLSKAEKKDVYAFMSKQVAGRVSLVAGIGGNHTAEVIETLKDFDATGYDAILSVSPYYNKPNQQGIFEHYMAIEKTSELPIILYNVPGRTGSNISASTTLRLAQASEKFVAIKEASGNPEQFMDLLNEKPADFEIISGDDNLTLPFLALGMSGVISVIGQAYPKVFTSMVRLGLDGHFEEARPLHFKLYALMKAIFEDGNPGGIKYVLSKMGICENKLRLPLAPIHTDLQAKIDRLMLELND